MIELTLTTSSWYPEVFLLPLSLIAVSQHVSQIVRMNRRLPIGHRVRGDVLA